VKRPLFFAPVSFLNPWMLMGLAAAAVPIAVHFFNLRRPRRVDFSSLAFVRQVEERTMQRLRLKRWLLLALRVLAVACLALAFAQPVLSPDLAQSAGGAGQAPAAMAVVVDNSLSMTRRSGGQGTYLRQAKARAAALAGQMRSGDRLHLSATAGLGDPQRGAFRNAGTAREAIRSVEARAGAAPLARAARRAARRLAESSRPNRELYLLTDLQKSTLADTLAGEAAAGSEADGGVRAALVPVGEGAPQNVAVTDVTVESRIVEVGEPARLTATLENVGPEARESIGASVYLGAEDRAQRVAQATADLEPGASQTVSFTVTPRRRGWRPGRVEIESDGFAADDTRHFVLHVPRERRVLVVRGQGQTTRYVELALASGRGESGSAQGSIFQPRVLDEGQLAGADLSAYDAVVLVGPQSLASGTRQALGRFVRDGGGLLLFPRSFGGQGSSGAQADYNALLSRLGSGQITGVSGDGSGGGSGPRQPVTSFERADTDHPLFEGVFDPSRASGPRVERPTLYRVADYDARAAEEQTLIRLSNGRPFLQEIRHGQGAALFMASAPNQEWSDLPTRGLFVPLLYRSLFYLSSSGGRRAETLTAGRPGELRVRTAGSSAGAPLRLVGPQGQEVTPRQQRLFGATLLQTSGRLRTPGVYDVRREGDLVRRVALNLDPAESDVRAAAPEEATARIAQALGTRGDVQVIADPGAQELARPFAGQAGRELWNVFLALALALLVAEMLVARHWTPEEA
jgi:hypothetical protein